MTRVAVVGAGPAGAYVAGALAERGIDVLLVDKRDDPADPATDGRAIQLSLSPRGLRALDAIGLRAATESHTIELVGRAFHPVEGGIRVFELPPGAPRNRSVARGDLTAMLLEWALAKPGIEARFGTACLEVLRQEKSLVLQSVDGSVSTVPCDLVIGTDGAASEVRTALVRAPRVDFGKRSSPWGYLELQLRSENGAHAFAPHAIHIWPRTRFFMVAFPSRDGAYRGTVVMPHALFEETRSRGTLEGMLADALPDVWPRLAHAVDAATARLSPIPIIRCGTWYDGGFLAVLGDAAHATAPFMGQGVNIALEDAAALVSALDANGGDPFAAVAHVAEARVAEGLACCDLSERAAHLLLDMPPEKPGPSALHMLNVEGVPYAEVARRFIPGWQPRVYANTIPPSEEPRATLPPELLAPFTATAGETLLAEGSSADSLLYIESGTVRVESSALGAVRLNAPVIVGEVGWFGSRSERTASVLADTDCSGGRMGYDALDGLCRSDPQRAIAIVRRLGALSVERLKEHFHPRAGYVVVVAEDEPSEASSDWIVRTRDHLAEHPIVCSHALAPLFTAVNLQPSRVLPPDPMARSASLTRLAEHARAIVWLDSAPVPSSVIAAAWARSAPLLHDRDSATRHFEAERRREQDELAPRSLRAQPK